MKRIWIVLALVLLSASYVSAQQIGFGSLGGANATVTVNPGTSLGVSLNVSGVYSGTVSFLCDPNGSGTFVAILGTALVDGSSVSSTTSTGTWFLPNAGCLSLQAKMTSYSSGTAVITFARAYTVAKNYAPVFGNIGVGGSSTAAGLTLSNSGTQILFAPPDANGTTWMQVFKGNNGTVTGGLDARGNFHTNLALFVSGGWSMTLNANGSVASVSSANSGLSDMIDVVGDTTYGVVSKGSTTPGHLFTGLDQNANFVFNVDPTGNLQFGVGATIGSVDTNLSRTAAGVLAVGNGTAGNSSGVFKGQFQNNAATITSTAATTATFLTNGVGGAGGPTTGAQNGWIVFKDSTGASIWVPVWK